MSTAVLAEITPSSVAQTQRGNATERFSAITASTPRSSDAVAAFMASKLHLLRTHPIAPERRTALAQRFGGRMAAAEALPVAPTRPVPGGVGYGVFYNDTFKTAFATGTSISWKIVCPTPPGGNVSDWLYLTATNRSSLGVEAFVSYHGQNDTTFNVFDWARPGDEWQTHALLADLGEYLSMEVSHGENFQVLQVMNTTLETSPGNWSNQVHLWNFPQSRWDLIYQFDYAADLAKQTTGWVGSWGPIVETFQDAYSGTSPMGSLDASVATRDAGGNWSNWAPLTSAETDIRTDNKGFVLSFIDPNFTWVVTS
jgi:hypothetical protein